MKFIKNLFKKEEKSNTVEYPLSSPTGTILYSMLNGNTISPSQSLEWYKKISSVSTSIDMISNTIKQIKPILRDPDKNLIYNHEIIDLLLQPNGFDTYSEFISSLSRYYLLSGNGYLVTTGNINFKPVELSVINPTYISTIPNEDQRPDNYIISQSAYKGKYNRNTDNIKLTRFIDGSFKELYHIMNFSSGSDNIIGDSPLNSILLELKQQLAGKNHNIKLLENGGRLSLVVIFRDETEPPPNVVQNRKKVIEENLTGTDNSGKVATFSSKDMDIQEMGKSNTDMDYLNLEQNSSKSIYLRYGIPLAMISTEASTYNNMENAILYFYENTAIPHLEELFEGLTKFLMPRYNLNPNEYQITYDPNTIKPIMRKSLEETELRKKIGVETINEIRRLLPNREEIEDGDDVLVPASMVTLSDVINPEDEL